MASRPPCSACARSTSTPRNFLLVCACGGAWHHRCLDPPMEDHALLAMITASNLGAQTASIRTWRCYECEVGRARAFTNGRDDPGHENPEKPLSDIPTQTARRRVRPEPEPVWPPRRRKRETRKHAEGDDGHFEGKKRGHATSIPQTSQMARRSPPVNNTELVPTSRRACPVSQSPMRHSPTPISVQTQDAPSHLSLPLVDLGHMLCRKRREVVQRTASLGKSPPAKKRRIGDQLSSVQSVASGASTTAHKDHISVPGASDVTKAVTKSENSIFSKTSSGSLANKPPFKVKTSTQKLPREIIKRRKAQKDFLHPTQIRRIQKITGDASPTKLLSPGFEAGVTVEVPAPSTEEITTQETSNYASLPANVAPPQPEILSNDAAKSVSTLGLSQVSQVVEKQDKVCEESGTGTCSPRVSAAELATLKPSEGVETSETCIRMKSTLPVPKNGLIKPNSQESPGQSTPVEDIPTSRASSPSERRFTNNHGVQATQRNSLLPALARWFTAVAAVQHRPIMRRGRSKRMAQMRVEGAEWSFVAR